MLDSSEVDPIFLKQHAELDLIFYLLLDESFSGLDVLTIKMLQQIIVSLQTENNIGICICDHQARDLLSCVDLAIVLSNCKIIAKGAPAELIKDPNAKSAYFGESFKFN